MAVNASCKDIIHVGYLHTHVPVAVEKALTHTMQLCHVRQIYVAVPRQDGVLQQICWISLGK